MADNLGNFNSNSPNTPAVIAVATGVGPGSNGVHARTDSSSDSAVYAEHSLSGIGVFGRGGPSGGEGVFGQTDSGSSGVYGKNGGGGNGVTGESAAGVGVIGQGGSTGVEGTSTTGYGVKGEGGDIGVYAHNLTANGNDVYLATGGLAGDFHGDVFVTGSVTVTGDVILAGADFAEEFDVAQAAEIEPGTVMVLDHDGILHQSQRAYDKTVAGVISGAGDHRPGMILDRRQPADNRMPVALVGKVFCKIDAQYGPVDVGDLLTTSPTPGHAMKADDPLKAFGSVIGKALRALGAGQGLVPILIALQ